LKRDVTLGFEKRRNANGRVKKERGGGRVTLGSKEQVKVFLSSSGQETYMGDEWEGKLGEPDVTYIGDESSKRGETGCA